MAENDPLSVVLITHERPRAHDSASDYLEALGYRLEWVCPALGDRLPLIEKRHVGTIVYGGQYSPTETRRFPFMADELAWVRQWLATGRPFLGLGLGAQILAVELGSSLYSHPDGLSEVGFYTIDATDAGRAMFPPRMHVPEWHFLGFDCPSSATLLATSGYFENQAIRYAENAFGFQFHPELSMNQHEIWLEEKIDMTTIPGAQDLHTQRSLADIYLPQVQDWFIGFLDKWIKGAVPE